MAQWATGVMITPTSGAIFSSAGCGISGFLPTPSGMLNCPVQMKSGQISSRPHTTDFPQMVVKSKGNPRKFEGEILFAQMKLEILPKSLGEFGLFWMEVPMEVHQK